MPTLVTHEYTRVWDKFLVGDECWEWTGGRLPRGYGTIKCLTSPGERGVTRQAHIVMYRMLVGEIPTGLELEHLCDNPPCVRPDHLEPVTPAENMRRAGLRRTHCKNGHPWTDEHQYIYTGQRHGQTYTQRQCRTCASLKQKERRKVHA